MTIATRITFGYLLAAAACSSDDGAAPVISNLTGTPTTIPVGSPATISGTLSFSDDDGDVEELAVALVNGATRSELAPVSVPTAEGLTTGVINWQIIVQAPAAGEYTGEFTVNDAAANASNVLTFAVTAQ